MAHRYYDEDEFDRWLGEDGEVPIQFAEPGGKSALRAATKTDPRNQPCPRARRPTA